LKKNTLGAYLYSIAETNTVDPIAFNTLSSILGVQLFLNKRSELDISEPLKVDGLVTFELKCL